jgi:RecA/RadA recombinase
MFVLDSLAMLGIKGISEKAINKQKLQVMSIAAQWAFFFQREGPKQMAGTNMFLVFINHVRDNVDMMGYGARKEYKTPGGRANKHMQSIRIFLKGVKFCKTNDDWFEEWPEKDAEYGYNVVYYIEKNASGAPWRKAKIPFFFHRGFDDGLACLQYLLDKKIIRYAGGWKLGDELLGKSFGDMLRAQQSSRELTQYLQTLTVKCYQENNFYTPEDFA